MWLVELIAAIFEKPAVKLRKYEKRMHIFLYEANRTHLLALTLWIVTKIKMFSAVILHTKKKLVVPNIWCQRLNEKNKAIISNSKNENTSPVFSPVWRNFHGAWDRSYYGIILRDDFSEFLIICANLFITMLRSLILNVFLFKSPDMTLKITSWKNEVWYSWT